MEWADAPFSIHLVEPEARVFTELHSPKGRAPVTMTLIDAATNRVIAIRIATMSPLMTRSIQQAAADQLLTPWNRADYDSHIEAVYRAYPSTELMVPNAHLMETLGA